jgi:alpha-amylase/alpha-mannosidase (GH57 family)
MKYILIFHANLNYAYLPEHKYEFVIRQSYEMTIDTMAANFPATKYVFEASGFTIEQIADKTPDVLDKLKSAIKNGQCEFMGSPYAHPMLPNFPEEDGKWSIAFSNAVYQKTLGIQPESFWNPECGWRSYVPRQVAESGYRYLLGDFEAYSRSVDQHGDPLRPEIYEKEHTDESAFYNFEFQYDLPGDDKAIHFPFNKITGLPEDELRVFLRSDRIAQFGVRHFMGMPGYTFEKYLEIIKKFSQQKAGEGEGALIIFADDAEYIGTNGWFRLKYENKPDDVFQSTPDSKQKLIKLVKACQAMGGFTTFREACRNLPVIKDNLTFDDDSAWHGAKASTWANTPMARLLRPWQELVRGELHRGTITDNIILEKAWYHLTNSYNSDGQWPPTLPESPHIIFPYNYKYCFDHLMMAWQLVDCPDLKHLTTDPVSTLRDILIPQSQLVKQKALALMESGEKKEDARMALKLIEVATNFESVERSKLKVLYPAEYETRANALVSARRLVGGVEIEKVEKNVSQ